MASTSPATVCGWTELIQGSRLTMAGWVRRSSWFFTRLRPKFQRLSRALVLTHSTPTSG